MGLLSVFEHLWPIRVLFEKKSSEIILDRTTFKDDESKVVSVWSWKRMKVVKRLVHYKDGKFIIKRLD